MKAFQNPVTEVMSGPVRAVSPETALSEVDRILAEKEISAVVLVDAAGNLAGVLSRTDLIRDGIRRRGAEAGSIPPGMRAADVPRREPVWVEHRASVRDAALAMVRASVHRVVVVDGRDPVGLVSVTDLMRVVADSDIVMPLSQLASDGIASVSGGTPVATAVAQLREAGVRGMLVVHDGGPAGVFTQVEALGAGGDHNDAPVSDWMNPTVCLLDEHTPLNVAAREAIAAHAPLIVVARGGSPRGVVSPFDMLYAVL